MKFISFFPVGASKKFPRLMNRHQKLFSLVMRRALQDQWEEL